MPVTPGPAVLPGWVTAAVTATLIHGATAGGLLLGRWDAGESLVGILLDSLVAYALWLIVYLRLRPSGAGVREVLAKTFVGLSLGVWGFIAMFRAITLRDTALLAINFGMLEVLGNIGDALDNELGAVLIVIVAAVLLLASLYFLGKIVVLMSIADLAFLGGSIALLRVIELLRYLRRHASSSFTDKVSDAEDHLSELCLHVFVKGWAGALLMYALVDTNLSLVWVYLAWSYGYDLLLRRWLWHSLGAGVKHKVLARAASRHNERQPRASRAQRRAAKRARPV